MISTNVFCVLFDPFVLPLPFTFYLLRSCFFLLLFVKKPIRALSLSLTLARSVFRHHKFTDRSGMIRTNRTTICSNIYRPHIIDTNRVKSANVFLLLWASARGFFFLLFIFECLVCLLAFVEHARARFQHIPLGFFFGLCFVWWKRWHFRCLCNYVSNWKNKNKNDIPASEIIIYNKNMERVERTNERTNILRIKSKHTIKQKQHQNEKEEEKNAMQSVRFGR